MTTRTDTIAHAFIGIAALTALAAGLITAKPAASDVPVVMLDKVTVTAKREVVTLPKVVVEARRDAEVVYLPTVRISARA